MFDIFSKDSSPNIAKIYFGSQAVERDELKEIINPYSKKVVTKYPLCTQEDAKKALEIANSAFKESKKAPLHQRIKWLEDVANKLKESADEFAKLIVDEVAKPLTFAQIEVQRCAETIELTARAYKFKWRDYSNRCNT